MRYTLEQAQADESLPYWWTEKGCPDWARDDAYRDIPSDLAIEVCYGLTEVALKSRLRGRRYRAEQKAKRDTERATETPEQRAERERLTHGSARLGRLTSAVKIRTRTLAEAIKEEHQGRITRTLFEWIERQKLEQAQQALSAYVESELRNEFARMENTQR